MVFSWSKIGFLIDAGGLEHVDIHKEPVEPREKRGRAVERARKDEDCAQLSCFGWASRRVCRFERKGIPCKYRHNLADQFREQKKIGEGRSGAAHMKPKAGVRTVPSVSASANGGGSGKG